MVSSLFRVLSFCLWTIEDHRCSRVEHKEAFFLLPQCLAGGRYMARGDVDPILCVPIGA